MFDQVKDRIPELAQLEDRIENLEAELGSAQARVQGLAVRASEAREEDLSKEALALNRGRKVPAPREPELRSQLQGAERALAVLQRRLDLARSDRSRYVQEHHDRLARLLEEARRAEAARVAAGAGEVLAWLGEYFAAEDNLRALARLNPPVPPENAGGPESHTTVWGNINTRNVTGGPRRGDLEGALKYLVSLGPASEVGEVEGESVEGAA
jgi:hypothetical protein